MKQTNCKHCGGTNHYSFQCFKVIKPIKNKYNKIRNYPTKKQLEDRETKMQWVQANPPTNGGWNCYLHISPLCLGWLTIETLTVDHVLPKGSHRDKRHDLKNLAPACLPCNGLKGSRVLDKI